MANVTKSNGGIMPVAAARSQTAATLLSGPASGVIGAGGGSVAWVDDVGLPKVGPQSTGAHPGPACYGRGGKDATLTDAFLVSGFLDAERFLGGRMPPHKALAHDAIARFADPLRMAPNEAAQGVVRVAVSDMYA